ncbi:MAG TPA: hypothetical protein VGQ83_16365 [Polyangia bacterium]|jgi:hypothetical protein
MRPVALPRWRRALRAVGLDDPVVGALGAVLVVYYCATPGIFQGKASGDGLFGFFYLPGLVFHHTLDLGPPAGDAWIGVLGRTATGRVANPCPIGPVVLWAPPYLLGLALKPLARLVVAIPAPALPGQTTYDFWMAGLGSLLAGLVGLGLTFKLLARRLGRGAARFGVAGAALATPLAFYLVTQPLYQHAAAFFAAALFVERWDAWRGGMSLRRAAALGALGGLAMLMRLQEAVWLALPLLDAAAGAWRARRDRAAAVRVLGRGLALLAVAAVAFAPQVLLWRYYYGAARPPQPPGHMRWGDPALVATLFSMRGGLLPWSPILYLALPGLLLARRRLGGLAGPLALVLGLTLWVNAAAWDHWGSWAFGARRFTGVTVVFAAGLAGCWALVAAGARRRAATAALVGAAVLAIGLNGLLMELVRRRVVHSSGAAALPAGYWVRLARGPAWLAGLLDRTGYPFAQPAGWIYAAVHRVPARTFEGVVGNYLVERDWRSHEVVQVRGFDFGDPHGWAVAGVPPAAAAPGRAAGAITTGGGLRILVPLFAREPLRLRLLGDLGAAARPLRATWNGAALGAGAAAAGEARWEVPAALVRTRARTNELVIEGLPAGVRLRRLAVEPLAPWGTR